MSEKGKKAKLGVLKNKKIFIVVIFEFVSFFDVNLSFNVAKLSICGHCFSYFFKKMTCGYELFCFFVSNVGQTFEITFYHVLNCMRIDFVHRVKK
jgi:hypothetical protein